MRLPLLTVSFIEKAKRIHGDKYDYSLVKYIGNKIKVNIICSKHSIFQQTPNSHLNGSGCPKCYGTPQKTTNQFIIDANYIHRNKYDYSLVKYTDNKTKIEIICLKHGKFEQTPNSHLN